MESNMFPGGFQGLSTGGTNSFYYAHQNDTYLGGKQAPK